MKPVECNYSIPGLKITGWKTGKATKGRVVALHGWLDNANSFIPLAKQFPEGWELISLDLAGHGSSQWRAEGSSYHFLDYVTDTLRLCKQLEDKPLVIMGHSLGAAIATIIASCPPQNLKAAVLIDGLGPLSNPPEISHKKYTQFLKSQEKLSAQKTHYYKSFDEILNKRLKASPMNKEAARLILERSLLKDTNGYSWKSDPRHMAKNPSRLTEAQVINFLENIQVPTLFIEAKTGEYFHFRYKILGGRLKHTKHTTHITVDGDHHVHCDNPKHVAKEITAFLNNIP
ncbi:alpha/beta hydrolase [bacterium]|nr:alpha/beta hydrolase [bacterium]